MIYVKGKNVNLYVFRGEEYVLAICSTNLSRRGSGGTLTTLVRGAGSFRRFKPTIKDETVTLEGIRTIDTPTSFQIHDFEIGSFYTVRIVYDDLAGNTIQLDGQVLITGIDDNNGATDFSTWSVTMVRNGQWAQSGTGTGDATPPTVLSARATGPNTIRVTFSKSVIPTITGWSVYIEDLLFTTLMDAISGGGNVWDFTTQDAVSPGQTLFLNYDTAGNTLDLSGNEMDTLDMFPIDNSVIGVTTFTGYAHYFSVNPYSIISTFGDTYTWEQSGNFPTGGPMSFNISSFPSGKWVGMKEPATQPVKTNWFNTAFNYGTLPDSVFRILVHAGWRYYLTRNVTDFDTSQPLTAS